ncbi:hypothetical protein GCM10023189_39830 [Nibrella saemangeumensis]|uniref:HTH LytTR-type domain-containing protein n=1 Tax=Nibrella saemangeumensis TaxID=1084526 RepID=A0ABP8NAU9_9BACT
MHPIQYPDRWLRLVGVPVWGLIFRHIGEPAPLIDLLRNPVYYADLAVCILGMFLVWELNRWLIRTLDQRYSWATQTLPRLMIQGLMAYSLTGLLVLALSFVYNDLIIDRPAPFNISVVFVTDIPTSLLFTTILHLLYTLWWLIVYHRHTVAGLQRQIDTLKTESDRRTEPADARSPAKKTLLVNQGRGFVPVPTSEVAYIFITNEMSVVKTADNQSFTVDATLEQLTEQLPAEDFFRINRQFIANRQCIRKVENDGSGRLLLQLQPSCNDEVAVSRRRAPEFRQWMGV